MLNNKGNATQEAILKIIEKTFKKSDATPEYYFFKEGDFASDLNISRSKIREAISSLEIRGYVKRVHGRGVKAIDRSMEAVTNSISDMVTRSNFDYRDILSFREILEVKGAGLAAKNRDKKNLSQMEYYIKIMTGDVSYKEYLDADLLFHEEVINATQNKMLIALIASYSKVIRYAIEISTDENYRPELGEKYHQKIYKAIEARDSLASEESMNAHLTASKVNIGTLKKVESISW